MAGPGGGPSRRSHTKSRKGCKTCKKRHIRCDETFPQCRNCTKHQVRCDYMETAAAAGGDLSGGHGQANLLWTADIERSVDLWRQTGEFPFPELRFYPQPQWQSFSKTDLRLIHHLCSISNEMIRMKTSRLTLWTEYMPQFLTMAATSGFVMHSLLAFSASHLAWISQSAETRNLAFRYGGIALKGLHEAIGAFSRANADSVLAASLLLSWQATEWRGWASLMTGTKTIISQMQPWRRQSIFAQYLAENGADTSLHFANSSQQQVSPGARQEQLSILRHVHSSLKRLQPYLATSDHDSKYFEQLVGYVDRLRNTTPPQSAMEQFSQLYALRKWLFWVPVSLLANRKGDVMRLMTLAYFYATALALEPVFPTLGADFCADIALHPLDETLRMIDSLQASQTYGHVNPSTSLLVQFPRETARAYRSRKEWAWQHSDEVVLPSQRQSPFGLDTANLDLEHQMSSYSYAPSLSPAFAQSPVHVVPPSMVSQHQSPYLDIPHSAVENHHLFSGSSSASSYSSPLSASTTRSSLHSASVNTGYPYEDGVFNFAGPLSYPPPSGDHSRFAYPPGPAKPYEPKPYDAHTPHHSPHSHHPPPPQHPNPGPTSHSSHTPHQQSPHPTA